MAKIVWLLEETVIAIHYRQISEHGGGEGVRDAGLLSSAMARPKNLLAYNKPRPDLAFLIVNGVDLEATQDEKYLTFLELAKGTLSEDKLAGWFRARIA
jgi:death-on-curing protein